MKKKLKQQKSKEKKSITTRPPRIWVAVSYLCGT